MPTTKNDIIAQLQKEILPLQGFRPPAPGMALDAGLGPVAAALPNASFPTGAVHEFLCAAKEHEAATGGFVTGILHALMGSSRACIWISSARTLFPPALKAFGVDPGRVIFIYIQKEREALWAMEEALKCEGLAAVVGEIQEISFTDSRRLQLAVEQSRVTGFILRQHPRNLNTVACVSRWKITSLPSQLEDNLPGIGHPRWQVELLKIRNGKPGSWTLEWSANRFQSIASPPPMASPLPQEDLQRQTG